ncbi:leucyl/phenylalanyl-tRNA--protein transferase [Nocardioides marmorisolisilvae]|uniref:Leucyl/phenylalanyl-tRNA--protein transferase n=1 Tax=Nocardioides marmorisolisilvae TaxID=1542737 RepID=A0A3N0E0R7_9ACTN|nr:leucyl/phenylalanyl-tRNA--protein transferase [Nocardioides marmorisolisilvae]RNL81431.1 leucyl/phenylalanyl-tRNA--protein transferase [Nocardioides marmorisolisilvae]
MPVDPGPSPWRLPVPGPEVGDLVALGADLEPATVLAAYRAGLFPMPVDGELGWWSPVHRGVLPLDGLRVSRSLAKSVRRYEVRVDTAFERVVAACAEPRRDGAWIDARISAAYARLHAMGWAHSVETWYDGELVGGLYGLAINGLFAGESMFSHARDASKVALVHLVDLLRDEHADQRVLDTQWQTEHLASLGVVEIDRDEYFRRLGGALALPLPGFAR